MALLGRNWNGYQVDDKGYFTGNIYLGSRYIEANRGRSVTRFFGLFAKLIRGSRSRAKVIDLIQNNKLKNIAKDLFRPNARVRNGSSMDAFRYEQMFGGMVGGRTHAIKLLNYRSALQKLWKDRSTLNRFDRRVTKELLNDIQNALQCN